MRHKGGWIAGAVIVVAVAAAGIWGYSRAHDFEVLARAGKADASAAIKSLTARDAAAARASFMRAGEEFTAARDLLGPAWLRGVPLLGRQLDAADDLAAIGTEGASAGVQVAELLEKASAITGGDRLGKVLSVARPNLDSALSSLVAVAQRAKGLSPDGLVPPLAAAVTQAQDTLRPMAPLLERSQALLDLERYLFSGPHRFLVLAQNNAQIRPTGGFPGTFGLIELGPEGLHLDHFADIYTLPRDTLDLPNPPGRTLARKHFFFRNANWWMDFPTSCAVMMPLWANMKQPAVDGVIAIDLPTIRDLLAVLGPITVPESKVAFSASNVIEQLSYAVEIEYSGGQDYAGKKNVVGSLARAVMERLTHLSEKEFLPALQSLATSANEKHIQLWVSDAAAQRNLVASGWSGAIDPAGVTDLVAVSNTLMRRPAKANLGVTKSLDYQVSLGTDGSAETTLRLGYAKSTDNVLGTLQDRFFDYIRVHRATGTVLTGGDQVELLPDATGLPTFARYFGLDSGATTTVEMGARVPAAAPVEGNEMQYRLLVVKQADLVDTDARIAVRAPQGWQITSATASLRVTGTAVPVTLADGRASLSVPLSQDLVFDVTLARA